MSIHRLWLVGFGVMLCLMGALGASAQEGHAHSTPDGETHDELDAAALAEIERLRADVQRLLSTLPPSLHDRVRALLVTPSATAGPTASEKPAAVAQDDVAVEVPEAETSVAVVATTDVMPGPTEVAVDEGANEELAKSVPEPAIEPSKRRGPPPQTQRVSRRATCNSLDPLDENGDGKINAQDRYWRYLYVWIDQNRDGQRQDKEVESTYAAGVREIETGLNAFYRKKGSLGEIRRGDTLLLDLAGNGFGAGRRPDDGVLMVDADGLGRGEGPKLLDASGASVQGIEPFVAGWQMRLADGAVLAINCPSGSSN